MTSVGEVRTQHCTVADPNRPLVLESGESLPEVTLAYETYGELSPARDNAILVFHALSGSAHAAGTNRSGPGTPWWNEECVPGWWDTFIGPGKALDTRRYFVLCANYLGGCYGSTGPASLDPRTGAPYGGNFPFLELADLVRSQLLLLDHLGIDRLLAVTGASIGGMLALELTLQAPDRVNLVIPIAAAARTSTLTKVLNFEQILAIENDPDFCGGHYYGQRPPLRGLLLARIIAHKTYVSLHTMDRRARKEVVNDEALLSRYRLEHPIESYMLHQGKSFLERFDANTYLTIVRALQNFDLGRRPGAGSVKRAFRRLKSRFLVFSIDSDVCCYPEEQLELVEALKANRLPCEYITVHSDKGHDSFLTEPHKFAPYVSHVLEAWRD